MNPFSSRKGKSLSKIAYSRRDRGYYIIVNSDNILSEKRNEAENKTTLKQTARRVRVQSISFTWLARKGLILVRARFFSR